MIVSVRSILIEIFYFVISATELFRCIVRFIYTSHSLTLSLYIYIREHFKIFAGRSAAQPLCRSHAAVPLSCRCAALMPLCRSHAAVPLSCRSAALIPLCRSHAALSQHNEFVLITF